MAPTELADLPGLKRLTKPGCQPCGVGREAPLTAGREALELTPKAPHRLQGLIRAWRHAIGSRLIAEVHYLCAPGLTRKAVERAVSAVKAEHSSQSARRWNGGRDQAAERPAAATVAARHEESGGEGPGVRRRWHGGSSPAPSPTFSRDGSAAAGQSNGRRTSRPPRGLRVTILCSRTAPAEPRPRDPVVES